ncbi:acetate--CoA ligase family protein [Azohydromonas aeria]|uniref:acetate--CoA ligase family protein n=1 Tax=Azohydromonas aeria TaxID=2590212 RepID=UPI0012FC2A08|nr:acetate--CoA ligase family protein [Azohydromonas aeria]
MTTTPTVQAAAPAAALLRLDPQWQALPGRAYGSRQPVLRGGLVVAPLPRGLDVAALDAGLAAATALPGPLPLPPHTPAALALAQRLLFWSCALQRQALLPVHGNASAWLPGPPAEASAPQRVEAALPCATPRAAAATLAWVAGALQAALAGAAPRPESLERLREQLQADRAGGINTHRFLAAAAQLDLPVTPVAGNVHRFGDGRHACWLDSSFTERTPAIGTRLAQDKVQTAQVLRQRGLPAPVHALAADADAALRVARRLGWPVVVKPADTDQGRGVAAGLCDEESLRAAFAAARAHSARVLVEKHFDGSDHRMTVFQGELLKTTVRRPGGVEGDGVQNVAQLVALAQRGAELQRRSRERGRGELLALDEEALGLLAQAGLTPQSVPAPGRYVALRRRANVSAGGSIALVPPEAVHPDNRRLAVEVAAALQLDLAGIDLLIPDISTSWLESGAVVCDVNSQPQIGSSTSPHVYAELLRRLVPRGGRIPVLLALGAPALAGALAAALPPLPRAGVLGCASALGVHVGGVPVAGRLDSAFDAGQAVLAHRGVDAAVLALPWGPLQRTGLPMDRCDVLLLTPPPPALPEGAVREALRLVLPHARGVVVLPQAMRGLLPAGFGTGSAPRLLFESDTAACIARAARCLEETCHD